MSKNRKGVIVKIQDSRLFKGLSVCLALNLLVEMFQPTMALALTEGPSQPEVQSFEPIGTTEMVDLFTGDFNYNIPLFNLPGPNGGYPVNIAYHAGISMEDEASWVGLGWNINAGSLVRNKRGLPDEFLSDAKDKRNAHGHKDHLEVKSDMKQSWTLGASFSLGNTEVMGAPLDFSLNFGGYYNNFRGIGTSVSANVGKPTGNFSLGLSLDSNNGLGVSASVSHQGENKSKSFKHSLGLDFNGNLGVSYTLGVTDKEGEGTHIEGKTKETQMSVKKSINSYSSSMSFARSSFNPSISKGMTSYNISGNLTLGTEIAPVTLEMGIGVFFNTEDYKKNDKNGRKVLVQGYDRAGEYISVKDKFYTGDFGREREGQITPESVFLANSYYNYDTYMSTGQGLSGYFRPRRNDIGKSYDPFIRNTSWGFDLGFEAGAGTGVKLGVDGGANAGWSTQGPWENDLSQSNAKDNEALNPLPEGIAENIYYQSHGEKTIITKSDLDYLGELDLARVKFADKDSDGLGPGKRKIDANLNFDNAGHSTNHRFVRNTLIHTLRNKEVENLEEFNIKYYNYAVPGTNFDEEDFYSDPQIELKRDYRGAVDIDDHKAGFKILNEEGSYYVYGLPAYNNVDIENVFSVEEPEFSDNVDLVDIGIHDYEVDYKLKNSNSSAANKSHKYINKTSTSPYAHSYLLTSVLGADYVDKNNDGPTDDDLGYWVNFDYQKVADDYRWRAPFNVNKAQYNRNAAYHSDDDLASYKYGEKELWYMARIETKTHIAVFITDENRLDNKEALGELSNSVLVNQRNGRRLKKIEVYDKATFKELNGPGTPLQTIEFEYNHELCSGAENSSSGKLTLKSIAFTSNGSTRGSLNKYEFDYNVNNPSYETNSFDGWGTFKKSTYNVNGQEIREVDHNSHFPYTTQFNQGWNTALAELYTTKDAQEINDLAAGAWCLSDIRLPSGGTIHVKYESDDYSHVQHKVANQMFKITRMGYYPGFEDNQLYDNNVQQNYSDNSTYIDEEMRRIYFKLEQPIVGNIAEVAHEVYNRYVKPIIKDENGERNLFFKSKMRLTFNPSVHDYVSGYLPLEDNVLGTEDKPNYGVSPSGDEGFVTVKAAKKRKGGEFNYHPMSLAAWTYLQTNAQELLNNPNSFSSDEANQDNFLGKVVDVINVVPMLANSFGAIRIYCKSKNMAKFIDLSKSCIRLASPDQKKFGGGHRVKEISISDNWSSDTGITDGTSEYGQSYDYTVNDYTHDQNGEKISSGVAQYEPQAGGDENALKYPVYFYGKASTFTRNNLFTEAPLNESLFPGASVGYRRVAVTSLNTAEQIRNNQEPNGQGVGRTGGVTIHEFYTAKEFPTMVSHSILSEHNDTKETYKLPIIIPFLGSITREFYHGAQSFMIETNDMHGKPKSTSTYALNNYKVGTKPITENIYEYQCDEIVYNEERVKKLNNHVDIIKNDGTNAVTSDSETLLGVEVDLFTDQRKMKSFSTSLELNFNVDVPTFPIPLPTVWPAFTNHKSMFKTFVTNKVVHRSGILSKTISRDLQSSNESEVLAYDEKSGHPVLTKVQNEFGDEFYNYSIPAYYHYDRLGHAYRNIDYTFTMKFVGISGEDAGFHRDKIFNIEVDNNSELIEHLVRGDELLLINPDIVDEYLGPILVDEAFGDPANQYIKGYFLGWAYDNGKVFAKIHLFNYNTSSETTDLGFKVIRSGRRNHHALMAANYLTKGSLADMGLTEVSVDPNNASISTWSIPNNVLSATASLFKDNWSTQSNNITEQETKNPFLSGNSGIWRPYKSYTYVGDRSGVTDIATDNPNLQEDGVMSNVPMFTWDLGNIEDFIPEWQWVNEVTKFSEDAYELENVNRLGIHSSALYGYDNSLTLAVGGNASHHEIGAYDFEMSKNGVNVNQFGKLFRQTNMNFDHNHLAGSSVITEQFNILKAESMASNVVELYTDVPFSYYSVEGFDMNVGLSLNGQKSAFSNSDESFYFNGKIENVTDVNGYAKINVTPYLEEFYETKNLLPENGLYHGKLTLMKMRPYNEGQTVTYTDQVSHTGKQSMVVSSTVNFDQPNLKIVKDKKYVLSAWFKRDNTNVRTYNPASFFKLKDMTTGNAITPLTTSMSNIIEGWQKVDYEIVVNSNNALLSIEIDPGAENLYVDDVRFSPKKGGITTYVYDPNKFWLKASLNVDNYATLFFYDEEGNLTIKKQETENGIYTITESRGHVSED